MERAAAAAARNAATRRGAATRPSMSSAPSLTQPATSANMPQPPAADLGSSDPPPSPDLGWIALDSPPSPTSDFVGSARWGFARIISAHWPQNGTPQRRKQGLEKILPVRSFTPIVAPARRVLNEWLLCCQTPEESLPMAFVLLQKGRSGPPVVVGGGVLRELTSYSLSTAELATASEYGRACLALTVVVDKEQRGHGYGRRLVSNLEASARERGFSAMCVAATPAAPAVQASYPCAPSSQDGEASMRRACAHLAQVPFLGRHGGLLVENGLLAHTQSPTAQWPSLDAEATLSV